MTTRIDTMEAKGGAAMTQTYHVSLHARQRYSERVGNGSIDDHARAIATAVRIGARTVKLSAGQRLVIDATTRTVVTVLPRNAAHAYVGTRKNAAS